MFLSVLCMLSGFHAVYGVISGLSTAMAPPDIDNAFIENLFEQIGRFELPMVGLQDEVEEYYLNLMLNLGNYGTATFLFFSIQVIAVIMMYRLNRIGFVLYILAQIGLAASPVIFGGFNTFGQIVFGATSVWNGIWVLMYSSQLKYFKR